VSSPDADDLAAIVHDAQRGDRDALGRLLELMQVPLTAFVRVRAGDLVLERESAHDIVQSVCREVLEDLGAFRYRGDAELRNWFFLLATRKLLDRRKFHRRARRDVGREIAADALLDCYGAFASPSRVASAREELARIEAALQRLPATQRDAIAYSRLGLSYTDVAERMAATESAVRSLVSRGLARLADELEP